jgi:hypothetical protein
VKSRHTEWMWLALSGVSSNSMRRVVGVHGNHLYRNHGDGRFSDVTREAGLAGPATALDHLPILGRIEVMRLKEALSICRL